MADVTAWLQSWFSPTFLSPTKSFQSLCETALEILETGAVDEAGTFDDVLTQMATELESERARKENVNMDYLTKSCVLVEMVKRVNANLKSEHIIPLLTFFSKLARNLSFYLNNVSIRIALSNFLSQLEFLNSKCPKETRAFLFELWTQLKEQHVSLDLLSLRGESCQTYPLFDFFAVACMSPTETGTLSRDFIVEALRGPYLKEAEKGYVKDAIFPLISDMFFTVSGYASTIDFDGSLRRVAVWCDEVFQAVPGFGIEEVCGRVHRSLVSYRKLFAYAFFLSFISDQSVRRRMYEVLLKNNIAREIELALKDEHDVSKLAAFALLRQVLQDNFYVHVLPAKYAMSVDVLCVIPEGWSRGEVGDACVKASVTSQRQEGTNPRIYQAILRILREFSSLSIDVAVELCRLLRQILSFAPDLMNEDLLDALRAAVKPYTGVMPMDSDKKDSPEAFAYLLAELVQTLHSEFVKVRGSTF